MFHAFYLAWQHLCHHRLRAGLLVLCLTLAAATPLLLHRLLAAGENLLMVRAESTPLVAGARGSAFDLMLNALYFQEGRLQPSTQAVANAIAASGLADPLPIYARFKVRGQPLVGVTPDYFDWRGLRLVQGDSLALLGECVLGAAAAKRLGLKPGDKLPSAPENPFDFAGVFPLLLRVAGVLERTGTPDDEAVFIDLKTAWVIDGVGHGHETPAPAAGDLGGVFGGGAAVSAATHAYTEITPDNLASFHFHGDPATYPVTAVIAVPHDRKSATLLRGRYLDPEANTQMVVPLELGRTLLQSVLRLRALFDAVALGAGLAAAIALGLVFGLSLQLRAGEIRTMHLLGCSRFAVARLVVAEFLLLALAAAAAGAALVSLAERHAAEALAYFL